MQRITINVSGDYTEDLKERLAKYSIGQGELAREMGVTAGQVSRWMTSDMIPRMKNIQRIEMAVINIRRGRQGKAPVHLNDDDERSEQAGTRMYMDDPTEKTTGC